MTETCPFCNTRFEAQTWEPGECPGCAESYEWTELEPDWEGFIYWDYSKLAAHKAKKQEDQYDTASGR